MSKIEVNQISSQCGSTLTIGQSGDTVTLASGATQSGFGRTGTVDWCTTAKTAPFTGVSGKGYFVNTTCGAITVTLPATPTAGDIISVADYASTWNTNNVILCNNGSKINGICATARLSTQGQSITLVYVDSTRGWKNTMDSTSNVTAANYIVATGGTVSYSGDFKIHTFTADGCFSVSSISATPSSNLVDYMVVAGGGGSGTQIAGNGGVGGGGGGGFRESSGTATGGYTASPLGACVSALSVTATTYPITVGAGGAGVPSAPPGVQGNPGSNSVFSTITSAGGGGSGASQGTAPLAYGLPGGSGGGAGQMGGGYPLPGGTGNTPPVSPPQGNNGGSTTVGAPNYAGGGGGGATAVGQDASPGAGGNGGAGATTSISGTPTSYAGGGGAGTYDGGIAGTGGVGGGGNAGTPNSNTVGDAGTVNTGGGAGGASTRPPAAPPLAGSAGGSGIVIIRYRYQN